MSNHLIFWPIMGHILLVLALYIVLARRKKTASEEKLVNEDRRALFEDAWCDSVIQVNNCIRSQFEIPMLFYALSFVLWALDAVSVAALVAAWTFLATRIAHAVIHIGNNEVPLRRSMFSIGTVLIVVLLVLASTEIAMH